jgi:glyoxylase-like metal-dependent hydrolase (beta-lactamase superfamily II)
MSDFTLTVGGVEIVALSDMSLPFPMPLTQLFPTAPAEGWEPYKASYPDAFEQDHMLIEIGCYLVRSQDSTILIDTGYGEGPIEAIGGRRGELMQDLTSKGITPEEIDTVFISHLHSDHVGWNVVERDGELTPAFPNARYVVHQADLDHFRRPDVQAASTFPFMDRCVESIFRWGLLDTLSDDTDITAEVRALHTPGHTPGHMSIMVASRGEQALIQGDVLVHPAQVTEDDWNCHFDFDWPLSTETRRQMLNDVEAQRTSVISCHFPAPGFGTVKRREGRRYWQVGFGT